MSYVQGNLTDTLERELVRREVALEAKQTPVFTSIGAAIDATIELFHDLKRDARRYDVQYANG